MSQPEELQWEYAAEGSAFIVFRPVSAPEASKLQGKVLKILKTDIVPARGLYNDLHSSEQEKIFANLTAEDVLRGTKQPNILPQHSKDQLGDPKAFADAIAKTFFMDIASPLLSEYVFVRRRFVLGLIEKSRMLRPKKRLSVWDSPEILAKMKGDFEAVVRCIIEDDILCLTSNIQSPHTAMCALTFEIKPKWGFLVTSDVSNALQGMPISKMFVFDTFMRFTCQNPECNCCNWICEEAEQELSEVFKDEETKIAVDPRRVSCRFCMHQVFKGKEDNSKVPSERKKRDWFCPLDLFSGKPDRCSLAVRGLFSHPGNNLRVKVGWNEKSHGQSSVKTLQVQGVYSSGAHTIEEVTPPINLKPETLQRFSMSVLEEGLVHSKQLTKCLDTLRHLQLRGDPITPIGANIVSKELKRRLNTTSLCVCEHCSPKEIQRLLDIDSWKDDDFKMCSSALSSGACVDNDAVCNDRILRMCGNNLKSFSASQEQCLRSQTEFEESLSQELRNVPTCALICMLRCFLLASTFKDVSIFYVLEISSHSCENNVQELAESEQIRILGEPKVYLVDLQQKYQKKIESYSALDSNIVSYYAEQQEQSPKKKENEREDLE